ncbi:hypothetical protein SVIO_025100 [Streptomyces violaceusniger]|uniref:Uncharacterized protein n=1 Tax=Streptomyces violaceusniger TaxID=68280 RepID=A0A4D4KZF7_STRVO|nr:hypothetical protein SVIO_025100 [Streptomyces violaceusniger]
MLLARSRHASVRSLERYARPGVDSVARHVAERNPAARRRTYIRADQGFKIIPLPLARISVTPPARFGRPRRAIFRKRGFLTSRQTIRRPVDVTYRSGEG